MTDPERALVTQLFAAAWPLPWQVALGCALAAGYFVWSRAYYRALDPAVRAAVGRWLGVRVVWVHRHSSSYPTPFELVRTPYRAWGWGIADERDRTFVRDGLVALLSLVVVNVLAGLWPVALFLLCWVELKLLSYVVAIPTCVSVIATYSVFWSGRYAVAPSR